MTDRLDVMMQHCADLGLEVHWRDLGTRRGEYYRDRNLIVLNDRMSAMQKAVCLAHELAHEHYGDTCSTPAIERRAWEHAATLLLTAEEYEQAEALVGRQPPALAVELAVTPKVIEAWRRWWEKRGKHEPSGSDMATERLTFDLSAEVP